MSNNKYVNIVKNIVFDKPLNNLYYKRLLKNKTESEIVGDYNKYFSTNKKGATITLQDVTKVYSNGIKAVNSINASIKENEFVCLLGPSGCGKTTILRMLAGLESISSGLVKFDGNVINALEPGRRNLAMVFQNYALYPFMTVFKNISFGLKIKSRKNVVYTQMSNDIKELSSILGTQNKILKHRLRMLHNPSDDVLRDIKTAIKIKTKSKSVDDKEYEILVAKKEELESKQQELSSKNAPEIKVVSLAIQKYRKYLYSTELAELEIKGGGEKEINDLKAKSVTDLRTKLKEADISIKEKLELREIQVSIWKALIPKSIEKITSMLGINNYLNRKPAELSGGQRQRVALARAISKNSSLFLYDEPLSNLDAKLRGVMRGEIRKLHDSLGATSVYVTHDQVEAMTMADKVIIMNAGYVQQVDSPKMLYDNPANIYVASFIGTAEINILEAKIETDKSVKIDSKQIGFSKKIINGQVIKGNDVIIGIRPSGIIADESLFGASKRNIIEGKVLSVEDTGEVKHLSIKTSIGNLKVSCNSYKDAKIGDKIKVMINPSRVHIFDKKTGMALTSVLTEETKYAHQIWLNGKSERIANKIILYNEKRKIAFSNKLWRFIGHILSPKSKKEYLSKKAADKKAATKDYTLVEEYFRSKKQ